MKMNFLYCTNLVSIQPGYLYFEKEMRPAIMRFRS